MLEFGIACLALFRFTPAQPQCEQGNKNAALLLTFPAPKGFSCGLKDIVQQKEQDLCNR